MNTGREILYLEPVIGTALWGDGSIARRYRIPVPEGTDENQAASIRAFSGHPAGSNTVINGPYAGNTLYELYQKEPDLFGSEAKRRWEVLPVMMGVCHAAQDLSVQVHPREEYALQHEQSHGKAECWYIVDCDEGTEVVLGHRAKTMTELEAYIRDGRLDELVLKQPVRPGAFFNLEAGTLHALQKSTTFIEVCTCCTITYRFYDYNRRDKDGKLRKLDIEKAKANILIPYEEMTYDKKQFIHGGVTEQVLTDNPNFSVRLFDIHGDGVVPKTKPYLGCFVFEGSGSINGEPVTAGNSFLITSLVREIRLNGQMKILAAHG